MFSWRALLEDAVMLQNQSWVCLSGCSKSNLLTPGCRRKVQCLLCKCRGWLTGAWNPSNFLKGFSKAFLFFFFIMVIFYFIFFSFILISWRLITLQYCSGFCPTLTWISHGVTCVPHPDPPSHLPLGLPSAPGLSTCLMHPTWAGDLFHHR